MKTPHLTPEQMDLVFYGFKYTDFKVINIEACDTIANTLKERIIVSLCDENMCLNAKVILMKILQLQFHSDITVKVREDKGT